MCGIVYFNDRNSAPEATLLRANSLHPSIREGVAAKSKVITTANAKCCTGGRDGGTPLTTMAEGIAEECIPSNVTRIPSTRDEIH